MITIVSTRFSNETLGQNSIYRAKHNCCVYGSPQEMSPKILPDSLVFVIEMNNDTNQIEGVGLMYNRPLLDKYYKIYSDGNYNRYVFKSKYHVSRDVLQRFNPRIVESLDYVLFKEKTHLKRGAGFVTVPNQLLFHKKCANLNILKEFKTVFASLFGNNQETETETKKENDQEKEKDQHQEPSAIDKISLEL